MDTNFFSKKISNKNWIIKMTYCCGFKYKDNIFLYADSALTQEVSHPSIPTHSSFGEETLQSPKEVVWEAGLKIHKVSEKCFVAISANDFFRAHDMVDTLRASHRENQDFSETIKFLNNSLGLIEEESGREVAFLIAHYAGENGSLYKWLSFERKLHLVDGFSAIGSLPNDNEIPIKALHEFLTGPGTIAHDTLLVGMAAGLQSVSLNGKFLSHHNVGGTITGLMLNTEGVEWLGDTMYAISGDEGTINDFVMVINRENGFATRSSYTKSSAYFVTVDKNRDVETWMRKWHGPSEEIFNSSLALNWALINPVNNVIIVIQADQPTSSTSVCYVKYEDSFQSIPIHDAAGEILEGAKNAVFVFKDYAVLEQLEKFRKIVRERKKAKLVV